MSQNKKCIKLTFVENSRRFTAESIRNAVEAESDPTRWQFAMIHLTQAVELRLKGILEKQHPALVFENIDKPKHTVNIEKAIFRINKYADAKLTESDLNSLQRFCDIRNQFIHSTVEYETDQMKSLFTKNLGFLQGLIARFDMEEHICDSVPSKDWDRFLEIQEYVDELKKRAEKMISSLPEEHKEHSDLECPVCGNEAFFSPDPSDSDIKCCCCGYMDTIWICDKCSNRFFMSQEEPFVDEERWYCANCQDETIAVLQNRFYDPFDDEDPYR
jgi:hypothetical protein